MIDEIDFKLQEFSAFAEIVTDSSFRCLDEAASMTPYSLAYCQNFSFLQTALQNPCISAILCTKELIKEIGNKNIGIAVSEDPRKSFFKIYKEILKTKSLKNETFPKIGKNACIDASVTVQNQTTIGDNVIIEANSFIAANTVIGNDVYIGPNVVIGAEGLLTIREADGSLLRIQHAGGVEISDGCEILAGAVIAKSLFQQFTHLGKNCQIGILSNIGHGAYLDDNCVISGNSVVAGRSRLGKNVWMGTSCCIAQGLTIGDEAQIKMGSVVVSNIPAKSTVSGNFAVNHKVTVKRFLKDSI